MNNNNRFFQIIKLVAATLALLLLIGGVANLVSKQPALVALAEPTATSTKTPSATPALSDLRPSLPGSSTATPTPSVTPTATATATFTPAPTSTATATPVPPSATPTETATPEPSATPTSAGESTNTATPSPTNTATPIDTVIPTQAAAIITATLTLTLTFTATPSGPPTLTPTPTSTPTPVPRTERADNAPNYSLAEPHFWFTRPYSDTYATWGSQFYPYGTNNDGNYLWHHGIDIQNPDGIPILAVGDGQVVFAGADEQQAVGLQPNFYGQAVIIRHNQTIDMANTDTPEGTRKRPVYTLYGHVSQVLVQEGESVVAGQPIALTGQEGVALGPHLHLEVRLDQNTYLQTQNPDLWVRPDPGYGVIAGRVVDTNGFYVPQQLITLHRSETPNKFWRQTRTYPDHRYTFDPQLGETFTFADVPMGAYIVKTTFDGRNYSLPVTVTNQVLSFILIEGQPPPPVMTPTPAP